MSLFSALKQAKGLGSARNGTHHFIHQRASAIILIPLALYFLYSIVVVSTAPYITDIHHYFSNPFNAAMVIAFVLIGYYHGVLGLQVIIEDYVHHEKGKWLWLIGVYGVCIVGALVAVVSILRLAFA